MYKLKIKIMNCNSETNVKDLKCDNDLGSKSVKPLIKRRFLGKFDNFKDKQGVNQHRSFSDKITMAAQLIDVTVFNSV